MAKFGDKTVIMNKLLLAVLPFFSLSANAEPFAVSSTDKSAEAIGLILGNIGSLALPATGNALMGQLFSSFNAAVMVMGLLIVSYIALTGTINTAHEGEALGKKWSTIWIPTKGALGMSLLVPTASGYCNIQIFAMWLILKGIGAANVIWEEVVEFADSGQTITSIAPSASTVANQLKTSYATDIGKNNSLMKSLFLSTVCMQELNQNYSNEVGYITPMVTDNGSSITFGVEQGGNIVNRCGKFNLNNTTSGTNNDASINAELQQNMQDAFLIAIDSLTAYANEAIFNAQTNSPNTTSDYAYLTSVMSMIDDARIIPKEPTPVTEEARKHGWAFAGSYYFQLAQNNAIEKATAPAMNADSGIDLSKLDSTKTLAVEGILSSAENYYNSSITALDNFISSGASANTSINLSQSDTYLSDWHYVAYVLPFVNPAVGAIWLGLQLAGDAIRDGMIQALVSASSSDGGDPLLTLVSLGQTTTVIVEGSWVAILLAGLVTLAITSPASGSQGFGIGMGLLITIIFPVLFLLIVTFWISAATLGIYMPLIPYLVYFFTVLGWLVAVIEAVVAAPLIGLALIGPSEDEFGRAGNSILLIFGVAIKPSLIVMSFVIAGKLLQIAIKMISFGFLGVVQSQLASYSVLGIMVIMGMYSGLIISITHTCFSMIYIIPNKIMRWIGGHQDGSTEHESIESIRSYADHGFKLGKEAGLAGAAKLGKHIQEKREGKS